MPSGDRKSFEEMLAEAREKLAALAPACGPEPEPIDLFGEALIARVPELTRNMLPPVLADFAWDAAERLGVEPAMIAIPALVACAAAIHDDIKIQPRVLDTKWTESARLWVAVVAESGGKKTPAMEAAIRPLKDIEGRWAREDAINAAKYENAREDHKAARQGRNKTIGEVGHEIADTVPRAMLPEKPERPKRRRRTFGADTTTEALASLLADNEGGMLGVYDELMGMFAGFDAYRSSGRGKDRAAYLELWNGGPRSIDRKTDDKSVYVPNWSASIVGGIQPAKLRDIAHKLDGDGLLQRFLPFRGRTLGPGIDRKPDDRAIGAYSAGIRRLLELRPTTPAAAIELEAEAHLVRQDVENIVQAMLVLPTTLPALKSHLAKWDGIFARVVLTMHAIEGVSSAESYISRLKPEVAEETAARARDLMLGYFLPSVVGFYGEFFHATDPETGHARWIAGHILARGLARITARDIKQAYRALESDDEGVHDAMRKLRAANWVGDGQTSGNSTAWAVNPKVHLRFAQRAVHEKAEREATQARITQAAATLKAFKRN